MNKKTIINLFLPIFFPIIGIILIYSNNFVGIITGYVFLVSDVLCVFIKYIDWINNQNKGET